MRLGYLALSAVTGLAGVVFGDRSHRIAPSTETQAPAPESDRVRIEHQIVQIPVIPAAATPSVKKAAARRTVNPAPVVRTRLARSDRKDPFLNRAVQRIVGNGRYTPQPFPRPGR